MQEAKDKLFDYLLNISNGKLTLSPEQLEKIIDISPKQQSVLRQKNIFPIPYKKIGKLIHYPINAVINYLLDGTSTYIEQEEEIKPIVTKKQKKSTIKTNNVEREDFSHIFMMRAFASKLQEEAKQAQELAQVINKVADVTQNYEELRTSLNS